jgi:hypothetical protein
VKGIELASGVIFDATDEEGRIIHPDTGECLALDRIATILLQACLQQGSRDEALVYARARIDASDEQLEEGLQAVMDQLLECQVISQKSVPSTTSTILARSDCSPQGNHMLSSSSSEEEQPNLFHDIPQPDMSNADDWEVFLTGMRINSPLPHLSLLIKLYAIGCMITILMPFFVFRAALCGLSVARGKRGAKWLGQREWSSVCRILSWIERHRPVTMLQTMDQEMMIRLAYRELAFCHIFIRLFAPVGRCLVCSATLCAYLMAIGLPAQLVIGRARFSLSDSFAFHAWVEIAGTVVNDYTELQSGFVVLQRIPEEAAEFAHARI